jgi:hypothetical protein
VFRDDEVALVFLSGSGWFEVESGSFELERDKLWGTNGGSSWGYTFRSGEYRYYGPLTALIAIVVKR